MKFRPIPYPFFKQFWTSGPGLIPKHSGGWWIIYHLSAFAGYSINDFIDSTTFSLSYCSVDDAYAFVNQIGLGTLVSKIDLNDTFRLTPICQVD